MNTNKYDNKQDIFQSTSVFDYVSGNMSDSAKEQFERMLAKDKNLQHEVELETTLRASLAESQLEGGSSPISADNFELLARKIDQSEQFNSESGGLNESKVIQLSWFRAKHVGIAASLLMATFISFNFFDGLSEPNYVTLSAPEQSVDFPKLVGEQRLAKLSLKEDYEAKSIQQLLVAFDLSALNLTPQEGSIIVESKMPITQEMLESWRSDTRIRDAKLIKFDEQ